MWSLIYLLLVLHLISLWLTYHHLFIVYLGTNLLSTNFNFFMQLIWCFLVCWLPHVEWLINLGIPQSLLVWFLIAWDLRIFGCLNLNSGVIKSMIEHSLVLISLVELRLILIARESVTLGFFRARIRLLLAWCIYLKYRLHLLHVLKFLPGIDLRNL